LHRRGPNRTLAEDKIHTQVQMSQVRILASASALFLPMTVQTPNLALFETKMMWSKRNATIKHKKFQHINLAYFRLLIMYILVSSDRPFHISHITLHLQ
jgi:hypothetical protein